MSVGCGSYAGSTGSVFEQVRLNNISNDKLVIYAQQLEQIAVADSLASEVVPLLDYRTQRIVQELDRRLLVYGIHGSASDESLQKNISALRTLSLKKTMDVNDTTACEVIRMIYARTISNLNLFSGNKTNSSQDYPLTQEDLNLPEYQLDKATALKEMQMFIQTGMLKSALKGQSCSDLVFKDFQVLQEMRQRYLFIFQGFDIKPTKEDNFTEIIHAIRWPLGRALKMCGRPFHSHFFDHMLAVDQRRAKVDFPGIYFKATENLSKEGFIRALDQFDRRFLLD